MKISIICVYNNSEQVNDCLLRGLKKQNVDYELILLDGANGKFKSCAAALNEGVKKKFWRCFDFFTSRYIYEIRKGTDKFCKIYMQ